MVKTGSKDDTRGFVCKGRIKKLLCLERNLVKKNMMEVGLNKETCGVFPFPFSRLGLEESWHGVFHPNLSKKLVKKRMFKDIASCAA